MILDEPTSSLDKNTEREILDAIFARHDDKITFLISHNPDLMRYCTHILRIVDRHLVAEPHGCGGTPQQQKG